MELNKKKQILVISSVAALTGILALSQRFLKLGSGKFLRSTAKKSAQKWKKQLSLSSNQTERLQQTLEVSAVRKNNLLESKIPRELQKKQLWELQVLEDSEIKSILTKPQYVKYSQLVAEK